MEMGTYTTNEQWELPLLITHLNSVPIHILSFPPFFSAIIRIVSFIVYRCPFITKHQKYCLSWKSLREYFKNSMNVPFVHMAEGISNKIGVPERAHIDRSLTCPRQWGGVLK